jgi:polyhydroxybutyrate depolymerase
MAKELTLRVTTSLPALAAALILSCSEDASQNDSGGSGGAAPSAGGTTGGIRSSGGIVNSAGGVAPSTGGVAPSTGGSAPTGGAPSSGGSAPASGGKTGAPSGGMVASGGAAAGGGSGPTPSGGSGGSMRSPGCGVTDSLKSATTTIDVGGTKREYTLDVPENYDPNTAYKLIFGWHWRGGKSSDVVSGQIIGGAYYGLKQRAEGSAIFVAPNGIDNGWANTGGRDIAFLNAMLELFESKLCIDTTRIFSTGFSYGGMMSFTVGCDAPGVFRAIAPMSGALYSGCNRSGAKPVAVWMAHGSNDTTVPLEDGKAGLAVFLEKNGCSDQTMPTTPSPCVSYQGCDPAYPVTYCEFDGGHGPQNFAPAAVWDFFKQF